MAQAERQDWVHAVGLNISHDRRTISQCQTVKVKAKEPCYTRTKKNKLNNDYEKIDFDYLCHTIWKYQYHDSSSETANQQC